MDLVMTEDTAQGIYWELHHILRPGWTIHRQNDGFRVAPPKDGPEIASLDEEVWRIAQFVAYRPYVSLSFAIATGYTLESRRESGTGYRIYFDLAPNNLPDQRPVSDTGNSAPPLSPPPSN